MTNYTPLNERDKTIVIDFETRSAADISVVGADKYAEHPTTDVLCLAYTLGQSKQVKILTPRSGSVVTEFDEMPIWVKERYWEKGYLVEAWNVGFEMAIWRNICVKRLGWPDIPTHAWRDTMVQAAVCALPQSLGACGAALQLPVQKDEVGKTVMMKLSRPRTKKGTTPVEFWEKPKQSDYKRTRIDAKGNERPLLKSQINALDKVAADFETLYSYCVDDVRAEREIMYSLPPLTNTELEHMQHTLEVNERGIYVDEREVDVAVKMMEEYAEYQNEEMRRLTNGQVDKATNVQAIKDWMADYGVQTDSIDKQHVEDLIANPRTPDQVKKVLEVRQRVGKASTSKLVKMKAMLCGDDRIHGSLRHHGATTGRCIAEGSLILVKTTDGVVTEKPIKEVAISDLVWDGAEWVSHDGVVFNGVQDVIEWDGVVGTEDHMVYVTVDTSVRLIDAKQENKEIVSVPASLGNIPCKTWGKTARVYDIVNAGPRHRYTCNGKLVSNCTAKGGLQTQNFPRGDLKESHIEEVFEVIGNKSNWRDLEPFGEPMDVLSSTLRGFIKAPPGKKFVSADFANIEGRVVAWLSGEEQKLERFREFDILLYDDNGNVRRNDKGEKLHKGTDIYIGTAAGILNKKPEEVTKEERQSYGKVSELACLGPKTQVLTNRGYCAIIDLEANHKVWDGVEFVNHEGVICRGIKEVISLDGVEVTPDHKVLVGEIWEEARELNSNPSTWTRALATGSVSSLSLRSSTESREGPLLLPYNATAEAPLTQLKNLAYTQVRESSAKNVGRQTYTRTENSTSGMPTFAPTPSIEEGYSIGITQRWGGATTQTTSCTRRTEVEGSNVGSKIIESFLRTPSHWRGGIIPIWRWIESTLTKVTKSATYVLSPEGKTNKTEEKFKCSKKLLRNCKSKSTNSTLVYDLVNAGPRNRFTIKTNSGHLIVHNCGFGGSVGAYAMMAKTYNVNIPEPQAKSIVNGWRREHPEIMNYLYENARIVMQVIKTGEPAWSGKVYHYLEDIFLCTRLPSGRVLRYAYPRIEMVTTPWGSQQLGVTFMTMKKPQNAKKEVFVEDDDEIGDSKWIRIQASPGLFTENYTQAVARDIMVEAGLRIEKEFGYPIIMSVHDELVAEVDEDFGSLEEFERVMAQPPEWGLDIPIACEGWVGHRYKK